ncbi:MAG: hypothetical protein LBK95_05785 [Bifidobacteriaceae bacterium]|jgi:hypothetical protein|nr:hypothetical protein [Bifidobacteriaceae bacterium]
MTRPGGIVQGAIGNPLHDAADPGRRETTGRAGGGQGGSGNSGRSGGSSGRNGGASDIRVQQAREHQDAADEARRLAASHLAQRDHLVRLLYREGGWSYSRLARALDLTPELIAKIIRPQVR